MYSVGEVLSRHIEVEWICGVLWRKNKNRKEGMKLLVVHNTDLLIRGKADQSPVVVVERWCCCQHCKFCRGLCQRTAKSWTSYNWNFLEGLRPVSSACPILQRNILSCKLQCKPIKACLCSRMGEESKRSKLFTSIKLSSTSRRDLCPTRERKNMLGKPLHVVGELGWKR